MGIYSTFPKNNGLKPIASHREIESQKNNIGGQDETK